MIYKRAFAEAEEQGVGKFYFGFRGSPYEVTFPVGVYRFELWGASGGGYFGGAGGYSIGHMKIELETKYFLYIGGKGQSKSEDIKGCLNGGWNGGGESCSDGRHTSGGGGTDIRKTNNDFFKERIIVAGGGGGGGGSIPDSLCPNMRCMGGCGGGKVGGPAYGLSTKFSISYGKLFSLGGTNSSGGDAFIKSDFYTNSKGQIGVGGKGSGGNFYSGSGGGGYYGGGGGFDVTGGGGGSGFLGPLFYEGFLFNGNSTFPAKIGEETGHFGDGAIRITVISSHVVCTSLGKQTLYQFPFLNILLHSSF